MEQGEGAAICSPPPHPSVLKVVANVEDPRRPIRIVVEVLATEEQALALQEVVGAAICGAPVERSGPCRVAWTTGCETEFSQEDQEFIREILEPVETWDQSEVDRSLGL